MRKPYEIIALLVAVLFVFAAVSAHADCWPGKTCCYIGFNSSKAPQYSGACDTQGMSGGNVLAQRGYPYIVFGPASFEEVMSYAIEKGLVGAF